MTRTNKTTKKATHIFLYTIATLWLVIILALCCKGFAGGREKVRQQELDNYFCRLEKEIVKETRTLLNGEGFTNSGVTLTRLTENNGEIEYTLTIHHSEIQKLDAAERADLIEKLDDISSKRGYTFLINFYQGGEVAYAVRTQS